MQFVTGISIYSNGGLTKLNDDQDVIDMLVFVPETRLIDIFLHHGVDSNEEADIVLNRGVVIEELDDNYEAIIPKSSMKTQMGNKVVGVRKSQGNPVQDMVFLKKAKKRQYRGNLLLCKKTKKELLRRNLLLLYKKGKVKSVLFLGKGGQKVLVKGGAKM
ncbi:unnamed protein product [Prunus armeniaca]|uniref:Uncharacterized protein n=1 Tax=Prunus armeniaca TaxID=36596 RepID=A0A6J5UNQ8_PRUAR|nr:unnamed protein product [Prunus armeniaca]